MGDPFFGPAGGIVGQCGVVVVPSFFAPRTRNEDLRPVWADPDTTRAVDEVTGPVIARHPKPRTGRGIDRHSGIVVLAVTSDEDPLAVRANNDRIGNGPVGSSTSVPAQPPGRSAVRVVGERGESPVAASVRAEARDEDSRAVWAHRHRLAAVLARGLPVKALVPKLGASRCVVGEGGVVVDVQIRTAPPRHVYDRVVRTDGHGS